VAHLGEGQVASQQPASTDDAGTDAGGDREVRNVRCADACTECGLSNRREIRIVGDEDGQTQAARQLVFRQLFRPGLR
jgi:hypothetical protein